LALKPTLGLRSFLTDWRQRYRYLKPSSRDHQLGLASPLNYAAIQSGKIKSPSKKEAGLDVSHHDLVPAEGRGEKFFLDIPFHRMSVTGI
jgi:hypothetical protein